VWFALDSPLEGYGFEPSVPLHILTVSGPSLVGSVTVPFAKTEITLSRPGTERSSPLPPPSVPGNRQGGFRLARYRCRRGWVDLPHRAVTTQNFYLNDLKPLGVSRFLKALRADIGRMGDEISK
jgi:hypothetical protein